MCFIAYFAVKNLGFKRASVLLPLALSTSSLSQQQQYAFYYYRVCHGKLIFFESALTDKNMQIRFFLEEGFGILRFEKFCQYKQFL